MTAFGDFSQMQGQSPLNLDFLQLDLPALDPDALRPFPSSTEDMEYSYLMALFPDEQGSSPPAATTTWPSASSGGGSRSGNSMSESLPSEEGLAATWQGAVGMRQSSVQRRGGSAAFTSPFVAAGAAAAGSSAAQAQQAHQQPFSSTVGFNGMPQPQLRSYHPVITTATGVPPMPEQQPQPQQQVQQQHQHQHQHSGAVPASNIALRSSDMHMGQGSNSSAAAPGSGFAVSFNGVAPLGLQLQPQPNIAIGTNQNVFQLSFTDLLEVGSRDASTSLSNGSADTRSGSGGSGDLATKATMDALTAAGTKVFGADGGTGAKDEAGSSRFKRSRLRAKQRMQDMEREVEEKLRTLRVLASENEDLKTKFQMLEKVILVRDRQISLLKEFGPATEDGDAWAAEQDDFIRRTLPLSVTEVQEASAAASTATGPTSSCPSTSCSGEMNSSMSSGEGFSATSDCRQQHKQQQEGSTQQQLSDAPSNSGATITRSWAEAAVPWDKVLGDRDKRLAAAEPDECVADCKYLRDPDCPLGGATQPFESRVRNAGCMIGKLKVMPLEEVVKHWKGFVDKSTELLMDMDSHPGDPDARNRLVTCVNRMGFATMNVAVLNPDVMLRFTCYNIEEKRTEDAYQHHEHWRNVLQMVQLSEQQERQILSVLSLVGRELVKIVHQRSRLQAEWDSMIVQSDAPRPGYCAGMGKQSCELTIKQEELVKKVTAMMRREYNAMLLLNATIIDQIITPEQLAKLAVHSYPFFPHMCSISIILAEQRGMPNTGPTKMIEGGPCPDTHDKIAAAAAALMACAGRPQTAMA